MKPNTTTPSPPRITYHDSQRLAARDLQADSDHETQMRQLHVIGLHNTWGVALGLEVGIQNDSRSVLVGPGMAYDHKGRAIVLSEAIPLHAPPQPDLATNERAWVDLVISYDPFDDAGRAQGAGAACPTSPRRPNAEQPAFRWVGAGRAGEGAQPPLGESVRQGVDIPLARVRVDAAGQIDGLDLARRRSAQALVRPHITGDRVVTTAQASTSGELSWSVYVNTASYGFSSATPHYVVQLTDHPLRGQQASASLTYPGFLGAIYGSFLAVEYPSRWGFTLRVRFGLRETGTGHDTGAALHGMLREINELPLAFNWYGTEPVTGCQPPFSGYWISYVYTLVMPELFSGVIIT